MPDISVLIVDDHQIFRQGLRDVVESAPNLVVVGEADDGDVAVQQAYSLLPDVILMDVNLPSTNGLQVTRKIKSVLDKTKVITITAYDDEEQIFHALRAGASAYCPKDSTPSNIINTIQAVHAGDFVVGDTRMSHDALVAWLEERFNHRVGTDGETIVSLSPREMEILELVVNGMSNKEIALNLQISHQTVKNHMTAILRKMRVEDRTQAAVFALSKGWVRLDNANNIS